MLDELFNSCNRTLHLELVNRRVLFSCYETLKLYISILVLHVLHGFYIESKTRPSSLPGNWTWPETGNRLSDASCIFYEIPMSYRANKRRGHDSVRENS